MLFCEAKPLLASLSKLVVDVVYKTFRTKGQVEQKQAYIEGSIVNVEDLVAEVGCKIASLPSSYLGLLLAIQSKKIIPSHEDELLLKEVKDDRFSMKLVYRVLDQSPTMIFPFGTIWNPMSVPR